MYGSTFFILIFLIFMAGTAQAAPAAPAPSIDWAQEALRLTGESDLARDKALKNLRSIPKIKKILAAQLKTSKKALALDVIAALEYREFVPDLLKLAEFDNTGAFYLTINSLLNAKNAPLVIETYRARLSTISYPVAHVVILDTLGAMGASLPDKQIAQFLKNKSFEVRSSALDYVRSMLLRHNRRSYAPLLLEAFKDQPFQLRMQAVYAVSELDKEKFSEVKSNVKALCLNDLYQEVRDMCTERLKEI